MKTEERNGRERNGREVTGTGWSGFQPSSFANVMEVSEKASAEYSCISNMKWFKNGITTKRKIVTRKK